MPVSAHTHFSFGKRSSTPEKIRFGMNCACVEKLPAGPIAWPWLGVKPFHFGIETLFSPALECQWIGIFRSWHFCHSGSHQVSLKCLRPGRVVLGSASMTTP